MKAIILVFTLFAQLSWAGGDIEGNGGDVVVCPGKNPFMLDILEAKYNGFKVDLGDSNLSVEKKLELAIARMRMQLPVFADNLSFYLNKFKEESVFLDDVTLVDIPDSQHVALPTGCHLQQIAIFEDLGIPHRKVYTIDNDLWEMMDNDNKAILILHEVIYRSAYNHNNSIRSRYINGLIFSSFFKIKIPHQKLKEILEAAKFDQFFGVMMSPNVLNVYASSSCFITDKFGLWCGRHVGNVYSNEYYPSGFIKTTGINFLWRQKPTFSTQLDVYKNENDEIKISVDPDKIPNMLEVHFYSSQSLSYLFQEYDMLCVTQNHKQVCGIGRVIFDIDGNIVRTCSVKDVSPECLPPEN